jgi:predicted DNA-binding transcriptional regulator AlpA
MNDQPITLIDAGAVRAAFKRREFMRRNNLSESLMTRLVHDGKAPKMMRIGRNFWITAEAEREWHQLCEREGV